MSRAFVTALLLFPLAAPLLDPPRSARACGAFFASEPSQNLAIDAQRALLVVRAETLALHLQLAAATDGEPFSWIIPIPEGAGPPTVTLGDASIFDALDALTTPSVTIVRGGGDSGGGLCGSDKAGGDLGGGRGGGVQHFGGGEVGPYQYDLLAGTSTEAIATWLMDNGYVLPEGFAGAITPYTERSVFVAVRLTPAAAAEGATTEPLVVTWPRAFEAGLGYALGLSKLSTVDVAPLLLWVLADKRQRVANFGSTDVSRVALAMRDEALDYPEAVAALTAEAGGSLFITEFARDLRALSGSPALADLAPVIADDAFYLTRLYAEVPRDAIEDLVITFAANAPEVEPAVTVTDSGAASGLTIAMSILMLTWRRRRA